MSRERSLRDQLYNDTGEPKVMSVSPDIRLQFLRKVYGLLSLQLLFTTLVATLFIVDKRIPEYIFNHLWALFILMISSLILIPVIAVNSRNVPTNYILLFLFTLCESIIVGISVFFYEVSSVIEAFLLTACVTLALTFYAFTSTTDFSSWGAGLFAALWIFLLASILQLFFPYDEGINRVMAAAGAILFSLYIIYDTQMIMYSISPEDYIFAAFSLYLDILDIFLRILILIGKRRRR